MGLKDTSYAKAADSIDSLTRLDGFFVTQTVSETGVPIGTIAVSCSSTALAIVIGVSNEHR